MTAMRNDVPHPAELASSDPGIKPPHSLEAEREVLAAVFINASAVATLAESLQADDFYAERHQHLFATMVELHQRDTAIDFVTMMQALRDRGLLDKVGGVRALSELLDRSGTVTNLEHYIAIVHRKSLLRKALLAAQRVQSRVLQDGDFDDVRDEVQRTFEVVLDVVAKPPDVALDLRSIAARGDDNWLVDPPPPPPALLTWQSAYGAIPSLFLPMECVSMLAAAGGTGKGWLLFALAISIGSGVPWLETYQVEQKGRVLLALGEDNVDEARRRLWATVRLLGDVADLEVQYLLQEVARNVVLLPLMGKTVDALDRTGRVTPFHRELRKRLADEEWRALIFDPLSRQGGPDMEKDSYAATAVIRHYETFAELPGKPAVILSHHTNKTALSDDVDRTQALVRGTTALVDGARFVAFFESLQRTRGDGKVTRRGRARMSIVKGNRGPKPDPLELVRRPNGTLRPLQDHELIAEREAEDEARAASSRKRIKRAPGPENTL